MAKKVNAGLWRNPPKRIQNNQYVSDTIYVSGGKNDHGGSTVYVRCGFCETEHEVYIWSFAGCGRRCQSCAALMSSRATYAQMDNIKKKKGKEVYKDEHQ